MPGPLRYLIYIVLAGLGLAAGRYVIPATRSVLDRSGDTGLVEATRREFWKGKVEELLAAATQPEQKVARAVTMLDRITATEFPAVLDAVRDDESLLAVVAASWAEADAPGFFKYLASQSDPAEREMKLAATLITRWAQRDPRAAEAAASRLRVPGLEPDPYKALALAQLRTDVRQGLDYLQKQNLTLPDAVLFHELDVTNLKAPQWKGLDVAGRMEFLNSLPRSPWQGAALAKLSELWLQQSPAAILKEAQTSGKGMGFVNAAAVSWVKQDAAAATSFFDEQAQGQVKATLGLALAKELGTSDPQAGWDFASASLAGQPRVDAEEFIVTRTAQVDPAAAWRWIRDLPEAPWRGRVMLAIQQAWQAKNPAEAAAWWEGLEPTEQSEIRDPSR
jgi:hypothetical protein